MDVFPGTRWRGTTRRHPKVVTVEAVRTRTVRLVRDHERTTDPRGQWMPTALFLRYYAPLGRRG